MFTTTQKKTGLQVGLSSETSFWRHKVHPLVASPKGYYLWTNLFNLYRRHKEVWSSIVYFSPLSPVFLLSILCLLSFFMLLIEINSCLEFLEWHCRGLWDVSFRCPIVNTQTLFKRPFSRVRFSFQPPAPSQSCLHTQSPCLLFRRMVRPFRVANHLFLNHSQTKKSSRNSSR